MIEIFLISLFTYLIGSIPFGYILTKTFLNKDIRTIGSGNIGATNVLRTGNKNIGYATLILDLAKAIIPMLIINIQFQEYIYLGSLCIFIGHVFPIWLKFRGGKGVAVYIGILFCINFYLGIVFICTWFLTFLIFKYSSLSSIISSLSIPIINYVLIDKGNFYFYIIMFVLIFFTHRENIKRLINNKENKSKIY